MGNTRPGSQIRRRLGRILLSAALVVLAPAAALAGVTSITPSTWNIIGLDSNTPAFGPNRFPVGAKVCSDSAGPVTAQLIWDTGGTTNDDSVIKLRTGTSDTLSLNFAGAGCLDAFFEVEVTKASTSYDQTRRYHISAGGLSTPTPRELKVERLVSQSRNAISDMQFGTSPGALTSVPNGGSFSLTVGKTYYIKMLGYTATQGYEQLESFVNFPNTIFQVLSVQATYSADTSAIVNSPNDKLYADSCGWDNDPASPSYLSCYSEGKAGGLVEVLYQVKILDVSSSREELNSLIHDFSGSSFHYNADYSTSARFANVVNPNDVTIAKSFAPTPIAAGGTSTLTIAITNPTNGTIGSLEFTDIFPTAPGAMKVAATPNVINGCGGTLTDSDGNPGLPLANDIGIKLVGGSVLGLSTCLIKVNVTTDTVEGSYNNTTGALWAEGGNTTKTASATLVVDNNSFPKPTPPSTCGTRTEMVRWNFNNAAATPTAPAYSSKHADVGSATSAYSGTGTAAIDTTDPGTGNYSWMVTNGWPVATGYYGPNGAPYYEFAIDTSAFGNVQIHFDYRMKSTNDWGGTNKIYIDSSADGANWTTLNASPYNATKGAWQTNLAYTAASTSANITYFRIRAAGAANNKTPIFGLDNVWFDGCAVVPTLPPTITKAFSPATIAQGDTTTLTFTITNPNISPSYALTGVTVADTFPTGMTVASPLTVSNTCGGSLVDDAGGLLATGDPGIKLTGGSLTAPAGSATTCTFSVKVQTAATGTFVNTSRAVAASENGANKTSTGVATASLASLAPPAISKAFAPDVIFTTAFGGVSTLIFTLTNPNTVAALSSVTFTDTFPVTAGMRVAAPLTTTNSCGGSLLDDTGGALAAGDPGIRLTGGVLAAGGSCTVSVKVEATTASLTPYTNTTGNVAHTLNGYTATGNTASDQLLVETATPAIALLKQAAPSATGPWSSYLAVATGAPVYYRFTVENIGDVPLSSVSVSDPAAWVNLASCSWSNGDGTPLTAPFNLPVAGASNAHLASCITATPATAVAGTHPNTATASGTFGGTTVTDLSTATYATTAVTLAKTATLASGKSYYMAAGETINYSYAIQNAITGARLDGPLAITVTDNKISSVTCPALTTIGNGDINLDPGETLTCTASYTVTPSDLLAEQIVNIARANIKDAGTLNLNTPQATATVLAGPDLVVTKTNGVGGNASTNVPFTWTLSAKNTTSLGMTANFTDGQRLLIDQLPPGPAYSAAAVATNTGGTTGTVSCAIAADVLTCAATGNVAIPPDGGFTVAVTATPTVTGVLSNPRGGGLCRIDPDGHLGEINEGNNDCSDSVTVSTPAITLLKSAAESYFLAAGNALNYSYRVRNTGLVPQPGPLSVADNKIVLPATVSCPAITTAIVYATGLAGNGDAILDPGEQVTCTASYTVLAADVTAGLVTNTARATVGGINSPFVSLTVPIGPDLTAVKTHPVATPIPGLPFNWTLTATNAPTAGYPANFANGQILLRDDLPAGPTYGLGVATPATLNGTTTGTINCIVAAGVLTCTASGAVSIPPGSGFSINVPTTAATGGTLTNPRGGGICRVDPNTLLAEISDANNDCADSVLVGMPSITMLKSVTPVWDPINLGVSPKAIPGALMQYTFTVTNFGYGPTDAGTVVIVDTIPANMEMYVSDFDGGGPVVGPISFVDGPAGATTALSGLAYNFVALGDGTDKLSFSSDGTNFSYTPTADGNGCDPAVNKFKVSFNQPSDIFAGTNGTNNPTFSLLFKARIK